MALTISSMSPTGVGARGGARLQIFGAFTAEFGQTYAIHIGPNGNNTDPQAFSGRPGSANDIVIKSRSVLECFTPDLVPGIHSIFLERSDAGETGLLTAALVVGPNQYGSSVYGVRGVFAPHIGVGNRNIGLESGVVADPSTVPAAPARNAHSTGDTVITGTSGNDLATVRVFFDGVAEGAATVINGLWSATTVPVPSGTTVLAQAETVGGTSAQA